jgi:chromosome segregation ATPase
VQLWQQQLSDLETLYEAKGKVERPHSQLAQARQKVAVYVRRQARRAQAVAQAAQGLDKAQARLEQQQREMEQLTQRLVTFEQENATNAAPIRAVFRLVKCRP